VRELSAPASIESLQAGVGGYIEYVSSFDTYEGKPAIVLINEEGKLVGLPRNDTATHLWKEAFGEELNDFIVGPCLILQGDDEFMESF
jgi:hypothetical protein